MDEGSHGPTAVRPVARSARSIIVAFSIASLLTAIPSVATAAGRVDLTTRYPAVAVAPGSKVTFEIGVETDVADRVDLSVEQVPTDWVATLRGQGFVVDGVNTDGDDPVTVELDVTLPETAQAGTERIVVNGRSGSARASLALDIRVEETAAGQVTLTSDHPQLRGAASDTFRFTLSLTNDTAEDLTFGLQAQGPERWVVEAKPSGQAQAASALVEAGSSATIEVTAEPPSGVEANAYQIAVQATSPGHNVSTELSIEVTGSYDLTITTQDERLNASGTAGSAIERTIVVRNEGTGPLEGVALSGTAPNGWTIAFEPETVSVPANGSAEAVARITPSGEAIAGDYVVTVQAANDLADAEADLRVSIETSLVWGLVGVALIAVVLLGLAWVFRRYGRR